MMCNAYNDVIYISKDALVSAYRQTHQPESAVWVVGIAGYARYLIRDT